LWEDHAILAGAGFETEVQVAERAPTTNEEEHFRERQAIFML
jgi:hypothetical protein